MKTLYAILCSFLLHGVIFSQDTIKRTEKKYNLAFKAGGYYEYFLGSRYVKPLKDSQNDCQYIRFTKIPTGGFHGGALLTHPIRKNWHLTFGLMFCYRKNVFERSLDTVAMYGNHSSQRDIRNTIKYDYTYNNIEIPVMFLYKIKKMNFYGGVHLPIFSFYKALYTYAINQSPQTSAFEPSQKTIRGTTIPLFGIPSHLPFVEIQFSPWDVTSTPSDPKVDYDMPLLLATFQTSYDCKIKNLYFNPFLGIDFGSKKSFYLQGGIIVPIKSFNKSNT